MKPKYQRYRVYPNNERARSFDYLTRAVEFARDCFVRQGLGQDEAISIVRGSGSDFERIGHYDTGGWHLDKVELANLQAHTLGKG